MQLPQLGHVRPEQDFLEVLEVPARVHRLSEGVGQVKLLKVLKVGEQPEITRYLHVGTFTFTLVLFYFFNLRWSDYRWGTQEQRIKYDNYLLGMYTSTSFFTQQQSVQLAIQFLVVESESSDTLDAARAH